MEQVKISKDLLMKLIKYHLGEITEFKEEIDTELQLKLDKMVARSLYTRYKTSSDKEEQEKARIEYLDLKGYKEDFRW